MSFFEGINSVRLSYRELENLLAELHDVADSSRVALQGRIKHFQRSGWPGGTNTGKGRAAAYDFGAVIKLCLGFELLQLGVTPERAANLLKLNWSNTQTALSLAMNAHPSLTMIARDGSEPFDVFLYCDPRALASLTQEQHDPTDDTFFYTSAPEMARALASRAEMDVRRLALINISTLLDAIMHFVGDNEIMKKGYIHWSAGEWEADRESYKREYGQYPEDHVAPREEPPSPPTEE